MTFAKMISDIISDSKIMLPYWLQDLRDKVSEINFVTVFFLFVYLFTLFILFILISLFRITGGYWAAAFNHGEKNQCFKEKVKDSFV